MRFQYEFKDGLPHGSQRRFESGDEPIEELNFVDGKLQDDRRRQADGVRPGRLRPSLQGSWWRAGRLQDLEVRTARAAT
jgi:hypothetical protein